jgi:hypothetical protein
MTLVFGSEDNDQYNIKKKGAAGVTALRPQQTASPLKQAVE